MIHRLLRATIIAGFASALYGAPAALASDTGAAPVPVITQNPHIALLLPVKSKIFAQHAAALRDGFRAAAKVQGQSVLPVREYAVSEEVGNVLEGYRTAVAAGAQVVVGPLTRDAVTALAFGEPVPVPTLALNVPENAGRAPANLYLISLQVETEAHQAAQLAWQEGHRQALVIASGGPVQRRMQSAFAREFVRLGGAVAEAAFSPDPEKLGTIPRTTVDMYFLALNYAEARAVRAYLGATPVYATSAVHVSDPGPLAGYDLAGVRFVDMPWMLEPNHAAVMIYPRQNPRGTADLERLYALGIDAWRVTQLLLAGARDIRLDGVTGQLSLGPDGQIDRKLAAGRYVDGRPQLVETPARERAR